MTTQQHTSHLRLVGANINQHISPAATPDLPMMATGIVWGWRENNTAPLIIKTEQGIHFACGNLSDNERFCALAMNVIGQPVAFYHYGFDDHGRPIDPAFKSFVATAS